MRKRNQLSSVYFGSYRVKKRLETKKFFQKELLGLTLNKHHRFIYSRFVANHQLYFSVDYVRSKRHVNCNVLLVDLHLSLIASLISLSRR